ncbi:MAG: TRAP transporter large permease [Clostridiales Family XIII bacterium]|jgi:tripartite ATP-independent transporter DctM subunit|nr:TRAP transporter large permease [Clostridiales Family XIII bacterium]
MSTELIGLIGTILVIILMFLRVPVAFSMLTIGVIGIGLLSSFPAAFHAVSVDLYHQFASYQLSVVPLFALMGFLASYSGLGVKLFNMADKFLGHIKGGLCLAVQLACAIFGAISGSTSATIVTIGPVAYPEMKKNGYDDTLATACIASGANLDALIPPSVVLVVYGIATEVSVGSLLIAGILPGILLMLLFMATSWILITRKPSLAPTKAKAPWSERWNSLFHGGVVQVLIVFLLSIGGIFLGWFTATEAGAVGAGGMFIVCLFGKNMSFKVLKDSLINASRLTAMVFLLIACAMVFSRFFAMSRIPIFLGDLVSKMDTSKWLVFAVILFIYLILGMFIDSLAMILLTIPVFYPIVVGSLGYDPIWFGILIVLVLSMGSITPPIGLNVFVMQGVLKTVPLYTIFRGIWPYVLAIVICCLIIIAFPSIATILPGLLRG